MPGTPVGRRARSPPDARARARPRCASGYSGESASSPRWSMMLRNSAAASAPCFSWQLCLASQVRRPEFRDRRMIERPHRLEQLQRTRRLPVLDRRRRRDHRQDQMRGEDRVRKASRQFARQVRRLGIGAAPGKRATRRFEREIVAAQTDGRGRLASRFRALADHRVRDGVLRAVQAGQFGEVRLARRRDAPAKLLVCFLDVAAKGRYARLPVGRPRALPVSRAPRPARASSSPRRCR